MYLCNIWDYVLHAMGDGNGRHTEVVHLLHGNFPHFVDSINKHEIQCFAQLFR